MRNTTEAQRDGFTLTELLVLIGVGSVLAGVLLADLTQVRAKLLQQACAANMKHWGMAFDLYAQDYSGRLYYDVGGRQWDDVSSAAQTNVYLRYLGGDTSVTSIRTMRICPARMGKTDFSTTRSYSMPIGMYKMGLAYTDANEPGSPFYDSASAGYFPSLTFLPQPSVFLLLIESSGHTLTCGRSTLADFTTRVFGFDADQVPAVDRHGGGGVNCLFGDFHVEFVSSQVLTNQDAISCAAGNPWFMLK